MPPTTSRAVSRALLPAALIAVAGTPGALAAGPWGSVFDLALINGSNGVKFASTSTGSRVGWALAGGSDVNNDGYPDIIVGARDLAGSASTSGGAFVLFGGPNIDNAALLTPASLTGANGFKINGINTSDGAGAAVATGGDVNGDGIGDILIGAYGAQPFAVPANSQGEAYVIFGKTGLGSSGTLNLSSLNGTNGFLLAGVAAGDLAGFSVGLGSNLNHDAFGDIFVGAPGTDNGFADRGSSYIVYGASNIGASGSVLLSSLNGTNGIRIDGASGGDNLARSVAALGDANGDGFDDLIAGAPYGDPGVVGGGESWMIFGGPGIPAAASASIGGLPEANRCYVQGFAAALGSGRVVARLGDINGDGYPEVAIASRSAAPDGILSAGAVFVLFGGPNLGVANLMGLESLGAPDGFVIKGVNSDDDLGSGVADAGDINADGFDDILVSAHFAESSVSYNNGQSWVIFGSPTIGASGSFALSTVNGSNGFRIDGDATQDYAGFSCAGAGDVNGDGIDDIALGAIGHDIGATAFAGAAYILFGRLANVWTSPSPGSWATPSRWLGGVAPLAGTVTITPSIGINVTGPSTAVFLDSLALGAGVGRATLDLQPSSLVSIAAPFILQNTAALSGSGIFVAESELENEGHIEMEGMTIVANTDLLNTAIGTLAVAEGFVAGAIQNDGLVDIAAPNAFDTASLDVQGSLNNNNLLLLRSGRVELSTTSEIVNFGDLDIVLADATIFGPAVNNALSGINITDNSSAVFTGNITNSGAITLDDDCALTILGSLLGNGVSGPGGAGTAGPVFIGGGVEHPSARTIARFDGDLTLGAAAVSRLEIAGSTPGAPVGGLDQIAVAGVFAPSGILAVLTAPGFTPAPLAEYKILDFGAVIGTFSQIVLSPALIAAHADTSTLYIDGTIRIPAPTCPGDVNGDDLTNIADFNILAGNFANAVTPNTGGDLTGDGLVNIADFNILAGDFRCGG